MKFNFLYLLLYAVITLLFVSCSNERMQKMGITKKKPNQFSVSRKAPLEMPPDMFLRPPKLKKEKDSSYLDADDDQLSLDDILNNKVKKSNDKIRKFSKEKRILKKILNTKATVLK